MQLKVLDKASPWYADGLAFTCTQCGNCCTGPAGYVYASEEEVRRLAEFLDMSVAEVMRKYCRQVHGGRISLKERAGSDGYDCIFLRQIDVEERGKVVRKRVCTVYDVRPLQCRTWPFWTDNLSSRERWDRASVRCPGMKRGKKYTREQIERLRDATEWPEDAPSSK